MVRRAAAADTDVMKTIAELALEVPTAIGSTAVSDESRSWQDASLTELQDFIVSTHHVFTRQMLDTVQQLSQKVAGRHSSSHPETVTVAALIEDLIADLVPHMTKEEQILFPYVDALQDSAEPPQSCFGTVKNPIRMMMLEHDTAALKLQELRAVTDEYALPDDACLSFRALYERLMDLEQDLLRHIHLENNVLFPRAAMLEGALLELTR
jgi:regulator of cell morphogenesis and NO signaling